MESQAPLDWGLLQSKWPNSVPLGSTTTVACQNSRESSSHRPYVIAISAPSGDQLTASSANDEPIGPSQMR